MILAATGLSTNSDSIRAALEASREAASGLDGQAADGCVLFVTPEHEPAMPALLQTVSESASTPYVVGCSASGVLAAGREREEGPALAVMAITSDQMKVTPFLFHDEGDHGLTAGVRLGQRLAASRDTDDLVLVWPDPYRLRPDRLLQGLDATLGPVPVAGAAASGRPAGGETFQFSGAESTRGAVSGIRLGGRFRYRVAITQGCRPLGEPLTVTRAHENLIFEVDGRPALQVLRERAPVATMRDLETGLHYLFVGLLPEDGPAGLGTRDYWVRNITAADPDTGLIAIGDRVAEGSRIVFALREREAAREDLLRMLEEVRSESAGADYRFGLYFNCLARGRSLYREDGVDASRIEEALPGVPLLGFFGNAEIAPLRGGNRLFTYTGVLVLIGE